MAVKKPVAAALPQPVDPFGGKRFWIIFAGRQAALVGMMLQDRDTNNKGQDDVIGQILTWAGEAAAACAAIPPQPIPPIPAFLVKEVGIEHDPDFEDDEEDEDGSDEDDE